MDVRLSPGIFNGVTVRFPKTLPLVPSAESKDWCQLYTAMQNAVKQYAVKSRECGGIPGCGAIAFGFEPTGSGGYWRQSWSSQRFDATLEAMLETCAKEFLANTIVCFELVNAIDDPSMGYLEYTTLRYVRTDVWTAVDRK
jgi:hypothetical protein